VYYAVGVLVWLAFLESGVHATIAGVLVALTLPARNRIDATTFLRRARGLLDRFEQTPIEEPTPMLKDEMQQTLVIDLEEVVEAVQAPLQKAEHSLQKWVAFIIMPVFALANAGIVLSPENLQRETLPVSLGIIAGLVVGKPVGLLLASWATVRSGLAPLPEGVGWGQMVGVACLAGIGFTMSLFIAALGFGSGPLLEAAKLGILTASLVAGVTGYVLLRRTHRSAM
jgi:NhaA family Na+:H+ antiporter